MNEIEGSQETKRTRYKVCGPLCLANTIYLDFCKKANTGKTSTGVSFYGFSTLLKKHQMLYIV